MSLFSTGELKMMKRSLFSSTLVVLVVASCATTGNGSKWQCNGNGVFISSYDGSDFAYVRLDKDAMGHSYQVKLNEQRTEATGETRNGTPFTCKKINR